MAAWAVVFHLFGVIVWLGGLLVLTSFLGLVPEEVGVARERFLFAARRLFDRAANVGAALALAFGVLLVLLEPAVLRHGWFHLKLLLVAALLVVHVQVRRRITALESDPGSASGREFRIVHGVISALLLALLIVAVLRPF